MDIYQNFIVINGMDLTIVSNRNIKIKSAGKTMIEGVLIEVNRKPIIESGSIIKLKMPVGAVIGTGYQGTPVTTNGITIPGIQIQNINQ